MMDGLSKFEKELDKPRNKWSKAQWRMVALELAGVEATKVSKGRPKLTDKQKYESEQNFRAAEFWRDQATETRSVVDGYVGTVQNRKTKLRQNTATKEVVREAYERNGPKPLDGELVKKAGALERAIQVMQKNSREK
jgi:hypothetical protein